MMKSCLERNRCSVVILQRLYLRIALFVLATWPAAAHDNVQFRKLDSSNGLSLNGVTCIIQDSMGRMWIGTQEGLNLFDGYRVTTYMREVGNEHSLSGSWIKALYEDDSGNLWVGVNNGGVCRLDGDTERFSTYNMVSGEPDTSDDNNVLSITGQGPIVWVGSRGDGLVRLDPKTGDRVFYHHNPDDENSLSHNNVFAVQPDASDPRYLWVGTVGGLDRFDTQTGSFERHHAKSTVRAFWEEADQPGNLWLGTNTGLEFHNYQQDRHLYFEHDAEDAASLLSNRINDICEGEPGYLWIATQRGLNRLNLSTKEFTAFVHEPDNPHSLSLDLLTAVCRSRDGGIWAGARGGGVNYFFHTPFRNYHHKDQAWNLNKQNVTSLFVGNGLVLVAITGEGLKILDQRRDTVSHFKHDPEIPNSLSNDVISTILPDPDLPSHYWVTNNRALDLLDIRSGKVQSFQANPDQPEKGPSARIVVGLSLDPQHTESLWITTMGGGLNLMNRKTESFTHWRHDPDDPKSLGDDNQISVYAEKGDYIWVGSYSQGIDRMKRGSDQFEHFPENLEDPRGLSHGLVTCFLRDARGRMWIGTGGGLNLFHAETRDFTRFFMKDGLPNDTIYGILEDQDGMLWMSTNHGLSRLNPDTLKFHNYDVNDGLQSNEFNQFSMAKSETGEMFFGGVNGLTVFDPSELKATPTPPVMITRFLLSNEPVPVSSGDHPTPLEQPIGRASSITLNYRDAASFAFEFAALDFKNSSKSRYAYQLQPFETGWVETDARKRFAAYTNLNPGTYRFQVKAGQGGVWYDNVAGVEVVIKPVFWQTWWFKLVLISLAVLVLTVFLRHQAQGRVVAAQMQVNQRLRELDQMKDAFLANTSHELRTPLNSIIGLMESLLEGAAGPLSEKMRQNLGMALTSGRRLTYLVNDILDFSTLKSRTIQLTLIAVDLRALTDVVLTLSKPLALDKEVSLVNDIPENFKPIVADENRLLQILHNLVGNAVKFTETGSVVVSAEIIGDMVAVRVTDTGIGIHEEDLSKVFDSYEQGSGVAQTFGGTGLGLHICKILVELHGGDIKATSRLGSGTTISFTLPLNRTNGLNSHQQAPHQYHIPDLADTQITAQDNADQFHLLIVDDEAFNRQVLVNHLSMEGYRLTDASDGREALEILEKRDDIDLILLDIMMPKISGFDVCRRVRKTWGAGELPIILLSAQNEASGLSAGFAAGANDYIPKPISREELLWRVRLHLKLLDNNRIMEQKVKERTEDLALRTSELEKMNREMIRTRRKMAIQDKMATLGLITAGVAHEINNPINFAAGSVKLLRKELRQFRDFLFRIAGDDADQEILDEFDRQLKPLFEHLQVITDGAGRITTIVKDLSAITRNDSEKLAEIDLVSFIKSNVRLIKPNFHKRIGFRCELPDAAPLLCRPSQINQVLMNLLVNGCHAIMEKQNRSGDASRGHIDIVVKNEETFVCIEVRDEGCGMSESVLSKIFEPFFTTKGEGRGTGLGLSITFDIVEKHGGLLEASSVEGEGSQFKVTLPKDHFSGSEIGEMAGDSASGVEI